MLIGVVGKPNAGKSTFFKAATLAEVEIANYPFTTIKPNHGVGYSKIQCVDKELNVKCTPNHGFCMKNNRFVPVEILDVAGLVPGASQGKGLGNQFLDDLRQADILIHIVDASGYTDAEGKITENYDPGQDIKFLKDELVEWYNNILKKMWGTFTRKSEIEDINFSELIAKQFSGLKINEEQVKQVLKNVDCNSKQKPRQWTDKQIKDFSKKLLFFTKPMIIAANKCDTLEGRKNYSRLRADFPNEIIIPCSADSELALREAAKSGLIDYIPGEKEFKIKNEIKEKLNDKQKQALDKIKRDVLEVYTEGTGVQSALNSAVFGLLNYIAVFPVDNANKLTDSKGNVLPDCLLLPEGSTALDFAYSLHTDFGKNFIKAIDAKTKLVHGKEYKLKNRDVLQIVTR